MTTGTPTTKSSSVLGTVKQAIGLDPSPSPTAVEQLDLEDVLDCLTTSRRRLVIEHLAHHDEPMSRRELAEAIAFIETDAPSIEALGRQEYKRVYITLHQSHLPKLVELGVIRYDDPPNNDHVKPTVTCKRLATILHQLRLLSGGDLDDA